MPSRSASQEDSLDLALNSFVRRTERTEQLKSIIASCDGKLMRKGRSRNWQLMLPLNQKKKLVELIYQADEKSWLWLVKLLTETNNSYEFEELLSIARDSPSITINELMTLTNCSATEARKVLDEIEWS